jgi:hypothetical protein
LERCPLFKVGPNDDEPLHRKFLLVFLGGGVTGSYVKQGRNGCRSTATGRRDKGCRSHHPDNQLAQGTSVAGMMRLRKVRRLPSPKVHTQSILVAVPGAAGGKNRVVAFCSFTVEVHPGYASGF